jgi:regulator of replication initiation timing
VNKKASVEDVSTLETNLMQVTRQLSRLNEVLQEQNSALQEEVEDSRNPNYQQIFSYIDKQVMKICSLTSLSLFCDD